MRFDLAKALGDAALTSASQRGLPPLAIVILDTGAHVKFAATQDGAGPLRYPIALAKANAAIGMGMSTRQLFSLFEGELLPDRFSNAISSVATHGFAPQPGGELVMVDGLPVGAIGISGASSDQDEAIALAALQSAKQAFV
ncbi:MAG: GlcG/HbpS family heme-binding protein [Cognatishimia sp.]